MTKHSKKAVIGTRDQGDFSISCFVSSSHSEANLWTFPTT